MPRQDITLLRVSRLIPALPGTACEIGSAWKQAFWLLPRPWSVGIVPTSAGSPRSRNRKLEDRKRQRPPKVQNPPCAVLGPVTSLFEKLPSPALATDTMPRPPA